MSIYRSSVFSNLAESSRSLRERFDIIQMSKKKSPIPIERFIWDYWHVPNEFTYFRTFPHFLFSKQDYNLLCKNLTDLSANLLGSNKINTIWASYYVDYCRQELHQDISQGGWAFVLNLSSATVKNFSGGQTYLLKENVTLEKNENFHNAREKFDTIELNFGELLIFDGQIPHGVEIVGGTHDPLEGRFVIHGWFAEPQFKTTAKEAEVVKSKIMTEISSLVIINLIDAIKLKINHHLTFKIEVQSSGVISSMRLLTAKGAQYLVLEQIISNALSKVSMPKNPCEYSIILPLAFPSDSNPNF